MHEQGKSMLNVGELLAGVEHEKTMDLDLDLTYLSDQDITVAAPVKGSVRFIASDDGIVGLFTLSTKLRLLCSKDGEEFTEDVHLNFSHEFQKHAEEAELSIGKNSAIDAAPIIWDEIVVNIPMRPLCTKHSSINKEQRTKL